MQRCNTHRTYVPTTLKEERKKRLFSIFSSLYKCRMTFSIELLLFDASKIKCFEL